MKKDGLSPLSVLDRALDEFRLKHKIYKIS